MVQIKKDSKFNPDADSILFNGDCLELLSTMPDNFVKLIVTSPPYNLDKVYENKMEMKEYVKGQGKVIKECFRVLDDSGSICWQVGNYVQNGEVYPLDILYYPIFKKYNFLLRNRIVWKYGHGLHASKKYSGRYETILWFTKSDNYTFNLDAVRVKSKYPGKLHSKGIKKGKPSGNPKGKNPTDYWEVLLEDWEQEVWDVPNVKANHPEKTIHPCQFPVELVERCILALTDEKDRVYDPFSGVGSTLIAALKNKRKPIACEKELVYIQETKNRIMHYFDGTLKLRSLTQSVYQPKPDEKVAMVPAEWMESGKSIYSKD